MKIVAVLSILLSGGPILVSSQNNPPPEYLPNVLAGRSAMASKSTCCNSDSIFGESCLAMATNGNIDDYATGSGISNCPNMQQLVYDLERVVTPSKLNYVYCRNPGFSDGAVKDFELLSSNDGNTWTSVKSGTIPHDTSTLGDIKGTSLTFDLPPGSSGRYWKWHAKSNYGNLAFIWTCEIQLYESPVPIVSPETVYDHLVCYKIKLPKTSLFSAKMDMIANPKQEGYTSRNCKLREPMKAEFCVPAHKKLQNVPDDLLDIPSVYGVTSQDLKNDFICYEFEECLIPTTMTKQKAVDQFGKKNFKLIPKWKSRPKICVPAWKFFKGKVIEI